MGFGDREQDKLLGTTSGMMGGEDAEVGVRRVLEEM